MHKESNEDLFEFLLKSAVIENTLDILEQYPNKETLDSIVVPKSYDDKIKKRVYQQRKKYSIKNIIKTTRKIAVVFIIIMSGSFLLLLQHQEVRATCYQVIIEFCDKYIRFDFNSISEESKTIEFKYVPSGYYQTLYESNQFKIHIEYKNKENEKIILYYFINSKEIQIDKENYTFNVVDEKNFFIYNNKDFPNIITWYDDTGYYKLEGFLSKEELLKIAENIK